MPKHFLRSISCVHPSMVTLCRWFTPWGLEFHAHIWFLACKGGNCIYASSWITITSRGSQDQQWIFSSQFCLSLWFDFLRSLLAEQYIYWWGKIKCVYIVIHCLMIFRLINMFFTLTTLSCLCAINFLSLFLSDSVSQDHPHGFQCRYQCKWNI
jgi:hypothetical protein